MTDYDLQQKLIEQRRQQYGQQAQFQAPQGQMVGGHFVAPNALQYLAAGLRSIGGMRGEELAGQELQDLQKQRTEGTQKALANFLRQAQGTPENVPGDGVGPTMPAQAPNMSGAFAELMNAPDASLRQFGMQGSLDAVKQAQQAAERQRQMQALQGMTPQQAIASGVNPDLVKQYYESKNYGRDKVQFKDVGGQLVPVTEYGDTPQNVRPIDKTGNPFSDLVVRGPDGRMVPNSPLVGVKQGIARAGASNVSVNMPDKKFYEGLGTAISGQIEQGYTQAQAAAQTLSNANQIASSLDKAILGPGANQRVVLAQVGQALGVGGKNNAEVLANTRNVMQGLARQELAAAGQMKGQGQITESERAILRKAEAGQINEMTKPEMEQFISAIRKTARARISAHQRNLQRLSQDPQASTIIDYMQVQAPEDVPLKGGVSKPAASGGFRIVE